MTRHGPEYIHGTERDEQRRLSLLNDRMNEASMRAIGVRPGERILDLGCGLAQLTRAMAKAAGPGARALGVDRSAEQIAEALRQAREAGETGWIELREGDALEPPLRETERGSFDLAHVRFLLEHLPDPIALVRVMVRAVRTGGRVVLEDEDHDILRLWPEPPGARALWDAYVRSYDRLGNDPYVGRKLVSLLHDAGAAPVRSTWIFFGGCAGSPDFEGVVENMAAIMDGAKERILASGPLDDAAFAAAVASLRAWGRRPDAALWYGMAVAEGIRRA